jgi:hypothetical protein
MKLLLAWLHAWTELLQPCRLLRLSQAALSLVQIPLVNEKLQEIAIQL